MFNIARITHDDVNDVYNVTGFFGTNFKNRLIKKIGIQKLDALFIKYGLLGFSFYGFFSLEIIYVLQYIINSGSSYGVNVGTVKNFLTNMEDILAHETKTHLDTSVIGKLMNYKILDDQEAAFTKYDINKNKLHYRGLLFDMGAGTGKELHYETPVRVSEGWKSLKDIKVNDTVIDRYGKPSKVLGVYPQGKKQLYNVVFEDGRAIQAGEKHLWSIYPILGEHKLSSTMEPITMATEDIIDFLAIHGNKAYIDLIVPERIPAIDLPLDPYNLGVLLSIGVIGDKYIWLPKKDDVPIEYIVKGMINNNSLFKLGNLGYELVVNELYTGDCNNQLQQLEQLKLLNIANTHKFIPDIYLHSSVNQRWCLLSGIFDTGDITTEHGQLVYTTLSKQLASDIVYVIHSLGGIASYVCNNNEYKIVFNHSTPYKFFTLGKHLDLITEGSYSEVLKLEIASINKGIEDEAICIAVDNADKLYVVDNFIVTHNTFTGLAIAESLYAEIIVCIVPNNAVDNVWVKGLKGEIYKEEQAYYLIKDRTSYNGEHVIISTFETISEIKDIIPYFKDKKVVVIVDESHNFLDVKSNRTNELLEVINLINTEDIVLLSGTPLKSSVQELAVILRLLDKRFKGAIEQRFYGLYRNPGNVFKATLNMRYGDFSVKVTKESVGPKPIVRNVSMTLPNGTNYTLPVIAERLKDFFTKRLKDLEDNMDSYRKLYNTLYDKAKQIQLAKGMTNKAFKEYEDNIKEVITAYNRRQLRFITKTINLVNQFENKYLVSVLNGDEKKLFKEAKTVIKYASLKVQGEALAGVIGRARIDCHRDMALAFNYEDILDSTPKKTLIFSSYVEVCDAVMLASKNKGYSPLGVYGNFVKDLTKTVKAFSDRPDINPLVATYKSLGEAVPVTAANIIITMDTPFRMYIYEQAIARVWRRGQDMQTFVYIPLLDTGDIPNINSRNIDIINFFRTEVEKITGYASEISVIGDTEMSVSTESIVEFEPYYYHNNSNESVMLNW